MAVFGSSVIATAIGVMIVAVPASLASGALGPGRFQTVGIDLAQLALWWGIELFAGVALGMVVAKAIRWIRAQEHAVGSVAAR